MRNLVRGLAIVVTASLVLVVLSGAGMDRLRFSPGAVAGFRIVTYLVLAGLIIRFLILPFLRRPSPEEVALYLEEHEPELNAEVLSALAVVNADDPGDEAALSASPRSLARAVVLQAVKACREVEDGRRIESRSLRRSSGVLVAASVATLVLLALGPRSVRTGATALALPTRGAEAVSPYRLGILPGDATVARSSDQSIQAEAMGFDPESMEIFLRPVGSAEEYQRLPMFPDDQGMYEILLLDLQEDTEYFVRSGRVRSAVHTLTVADLPYVDVLRVEYVFPDYTGLDPVVDENGGDVAALAGTRVNIQVTPTFPTPSGALVLSPDSGTSSLTLNADGSLAGGFEIGEPGTYRILLEGPEGVQAEASPEYVIDVLSDQPPTLEFVRPGRDEIVTSLDEVFLEARAQDDYGVATLELVFSVNGSPQEEIVPLFTASGGGAREVVESHTLFLEEYELEPGDLVAYYARARDGAPTGVDTGEDREVQSDLYFLQIRPFRTDVSQADAQGGMPQGGGGGGTAQSLVQTQREIAAGTFNLVRDRDRIPPSRVEEDLETLATAQAGLRDQTLEIVGSMGGMMGPAPMAGSDAIRQALEEAAQAMDSALVALRDGRPEDALPPEQQALRKLQQALETMDRIQVATGGQPGGGGGGESGQDLLDQLGIDTSEMRNQYESVQRGERQQTDREIDETLERLKELARRQEQEAERQRRRGGEAGSASSGDRQRALAEETEEAARELERLSRESGDRELAETARQLQEAADAMRRSATNQGAQGAEASNAADRLEEARRRLEETRSDRLREDAEDVLSRSRELQRQQERVAESVEELDDMTSPGLREERMRRLEEQKGRMADEVASLEETLDRLAARGRQEQPEAARDLEAAADGIRDDKIQEKVRYSQALVRQEGGPAAERMEEEISGDLERLSERLDEALENFADPRSERLDQALDDTRDLVRGLESMGRQGDRDGRPEGSPGGDQGQNQEGQPGGQQGQQGTPTGTGAPAGLPSGAPGGSGTALTPEDIRQMRGEARQRSAQAEGLRRQLEEEGMDTRDLEALIQDLQRLDSQRIYQDEDEVRALQAEILEEARRFEYALRRALRSETEGAPGLSGNEEVPSEYRRLVEEYFRVLSSGGEVGTGGGGT
jgi:hypothetical protein